MSIYAQSYVASEGNNDYMLINNHISLMVYGDKLSHTLANSYKRTSIGGALTSNKV